MNLRAAPALFATLFAAFTLAACASAGGGGNGPYVPAGTSTYERQVIGALAETEVNDAQRQAVLAAFDAMAPRLKKNDADELRLQRRWNALDPRAASYGADVEALASEAATLAAERLRALGAFNGTVATTLDAGQWARWSNVMAQQRAAFEFGRRLDPTFRPGER